MVPTIAGSSSLVRCRPDSFEEASLEPRKDARCAVGQHLHGARTPGPPKIKTYQDSRSRLGIGIVFRISRVHASSWEGDIILWKKRKQNRYIINMIFDPSLNTACRIRTTRTSSGPVSGHWLHMFRSPRCRRDENGKPTSSASHKSRSSPERSGGPERASSWNTGFFGG